MDYLESVAPSINYGNNDQAYGANVYLNLGAEYNITKEVSVNVVGHNLLGLVSKTYNKRNYFVESGDNYRLQAASLDVSLNVRF